MSHRIWGTRALALLLTGIGLVILSKARSDHQGLTTAQPFGPDAGNSSGIVLAEIRMTRSYRSALESPPSPRECRRRGCSRDGRLAGQCVVSPGHDPVNRGVNLNAGECSASTGVR